MPQPNFTTPPFGKSNTTSVRLEQLSRIANDDTTAALGCNQPQERR